MTEQEAIEILKGIEEVRGSFPEDGNNVEIALMMAISALEKQIAVSREIINGEYFCPRCKYVMRHPGYCRNCGQHTY